MVQYVHNHLQPVHMNFERAPVKTQESPSSHNFAHTLKNALEVVNTQQQESDVKTNMLINGNDIDLHEVMIAAQKASITLETAVQIQKKMLDAYNEVMRMQI